MYVIGAERCTWKFADFQNSLQKQGVARPFTGNENVSCQLCCNVMCWVLSGENEIIIVLDRVLRLTGVNEVAENGKRRRFLGLTRLPRAHAATLRR